MRTTRRLPGFVTAFVLAAAFGCGPAFAVGADPAASGAPKDQPVTKETYQIIIDKKTQIFSVMSQDETGAYTVVVRQMLCSTAKVDKETPTGKFKINMKSRWLDSPAYGKHEQYACRLVGSIWIHSTCFTERDSRTLDRGSYARLGRRASAGCIRLSVGDAKWVYDNCPKGTVVEIVKSGGPEAVCVEALPKLPHRAKYDPTDPAMQKPKPYAAEAGQTPPPAAEEAPTPTPAPSAQLTGSKARPVQ